MPLKRNSVGSKDRSEHLALQYYRLGCQMRQRKELLKEQKIRKVPEDEFLQMAAEAGLEVGPKKARELRYKSVELASKFLDAEPDLRRLCEKNVNDFAITLSHILELTRLPAELRDHYANLAVENKLSCIALRATIRNKMRWKKKVVYGAKSGSKVSESGRPYRPPRSAGHAVLRSQRDSSRLIDALDWLQNKPVPRLTKQMKQDLSTSLEVLSRAIKVFKKFLCD